MTKGFVRKATNADVAIIAGDMREADKAEVWASSHSEPAEALRKGLYYPGSKTNSICLANGVPVGMYGVVPTPVPGLGVIWMLAANRIQTISRQFLRESKERIDEIAQGYSVIYNLTDARNKVHHRWIDWAGFKFIQRHKKHGADGLPFLEFVRLVEKQDV